MLGVDPVPYLLQEFQDSLSFPVQSKMPTPEELLAIERISADELAVLLRSDAAKPLIIDVRDEDFDTKGHIVNAQHLPKDNFTNDADVDALVTKFGDSKEFVFHCVRSNTRGPTCALRFMERAQAIGIKAHVRVLKGGFAGFAETYADAADLVVPPTTEAQE